MHFPVAIVLCDVEMQSASIPLNRRGLGHSVAVAKGHLHGIFFFYFLSQTSRAGSSADHHFTTVAFCLQKFSKFIANTNACIEKVHTTLKS